MADGYLGPGEGAALMGGGGGAGYGPMPAIKAKEIEAVRKVLAACMKRLRQMSQSLCKWRGRLRARAAWVGVCGQRMVIASPKLKHVVMLRRMSPNH